MLDPITLTCGILTTGAALGMCVVDMLPKRERQPKPNLQPQESLPFLDRLHKLDALRFDLEQTQRMREAGLKCSVINGRVVRDREI